MKKTILIFLLACFCTMSAQDIQKLLVNESAPKFEMKGKYHAQRQDGGTRYAYLKQSNVERRQYDVVSYNIFLDWFHPLSVTGKTKADRTWNGTNEILLTSSVDGLKELEFDDFLLEVDSVLVNGYRSEITLDTMGGLLHVQLATAAQSGDSIRAKIFYRFNSIKNMGFYLYAKNRYTGMSPNGDSLRVEERLAYTMAEPEEGRYWLPSNDRPYDKAIVSMAVRVPIEYTAVSNGLLRRIDTLGDARTFYWSDDKPITTYLIAVTASIFSHFSDKYARVSNPTDTINVDYYVWKKDLETDITDGSVYNARNSFARTTEMMKYFSKEFVEYPFPKYGMVPVQPFAFGGMEHQTITTITRDWLYGNDESGIAHELAHQWLGDYVTCATWKDVWLNEGGATWSEALWAEYNSGHNAYLNEMENNRRQYRWYGGKSLPAIFDVSPDDAFGDYSVLVYQKASWIYHMLREALGKDEFAEALRGYMKKFAYKSAETSDFFDYLKSRYPNLEFNLDDFANQWLAGRGWPYYKLNVVLSHNGQNCNVLVNIAQNQSGSGVPNVYKMPLRLQFFKSPDEEPIVKTVYNSQRNESFNFSFDFTPTDVRIDTMAVLCETGGVYVSTEEQPNTQNGITIYPNPVGSQDFVVVGANLATPTEATIEVFGVDGSRVSATKESFGTGGMVSTIINTSELSSGVYLVRFTANGTQQSATFSVVR